MEASRAWKGATVVAACTLSLLLTACSSGSPDSGSTDGPGTTGAAGANGETISTPYGEGTPVYSDDGLELVSVDYPDGSQGYFDSESAILLWVDHPDGTQTWYNADGTIESTVSADGDISFPEDPLGGGATMASGSGGTQEDPASMADGFVYVAEYAPGKEAYSLSGRPLGVYAAAPLNSGDTGTCYITYFEFQVDSLSAEEVAFGFSGNMYGPSADYVVNGDVAYSDDLRSVDYGSGAGECDTLSSFAEKWHNVDAVAVDVDYFSMEYVYLPEGSTLDAVIIGLSDDTQVYYAPTFLDAALS